MGHKLSGEAAAAEAARLLDIALILLDDAARFEASVHVAQAITALSIQEVVHQPAEADSDLGLAAYKPAWGKMVDRHLIKE